MAEQPQQRTPLSGLIKLLAQATMADVRVSLGLPAEPSGPLRRLAWTRQLANEPGGEVPLRVIQPTPPPAPAPQTPGSQTPSPQQASEQSPPSQQASDLLRPKTYGPEEEHG